MVGQSSPRDLESRLSIWALVSSLGGWGSRVDCYSEDLGPRTWVIQEDGCGMKTLLRSNFHGSRKQLVSYQEKETLNSPAQ